MEKFMKFDYSFVDLDFTVFDTGKFENDMWNIFASRSVSRKDYEETYMESLCTKSKEEFDYSFQEQVDFVNGRGYKLDAKVVEELQKLVGNNYLYSDSIDFIRFVKEISAKIILLTAGDFKFQEEKIKHCGIERMFDEVKILNGHKDDYLQPFVDKGNKILFVNDSWRENTALRKRFSNLLIIGTDGPHGKLDNDAEKAKLIYLPTLTDIKNYVIGLK